MKNTITLLLVAFLCCFGANANAQIITTVAGGGSAGLGDGGPAVDAELSGPCFVALDRKGNFYVSEFDGKRIRKINSAGVITTYAGTGISGISGDGGPATDAEIIPNGLTLDKYGNLYFADYNRIRRVDTNGIITTVAGNPANGFSGDGGPATAAFLNDPHDVAFDTLGNLYIADFFNSCIRKVDASGIITTVAGIGTMTGNSGDGGPATTGKLGEPYGIAVDKVGNIYVGDFRNNNVRKIDTAGIIYTLAGTATSGYNGDSIAATSAELYGPCGVAVDNSGNLYVADGYNYRLRKIYPATTKGIITTVAGDGSSFYSGDGGLATTAGIDETGVTLDASGDIYIADYSNERLRLVKNTLLVNALSQQNTTMNIYPNPTSGEFTVNISSQENEEVQVSISNVIGERVKNITVATNQPLIVTMDVPTGVYFLTARTRDGVRSRKIEVMR